MASIPHLPLIPSNCIIYLNKASQGRKHRRRRRAGGCQPSSVCPSFHAAAPLPSTGAPLHTHTHVHTHTCARSRPPLPPPRRQASSWSAPALAPRQPPASNSAGEPWLGGGQSASPQGPGAETLTRGKGDSPAQRCSFPSQQLQRGLAEEPHGAGMMEV